MLVQAKLVAGLNWANIWLMLGSMVLVGWLTERTAFAACGDHVLVNGMHLGASTPVETQSPWEQPAPCHGPGCGQSPLTAGTSTVTVKKSVERWVGSLVKIKTSFADLKLGPVSPLHDTVLVGRQIVSIWRPPQ